MRIASDMMLASARLVSCRPWRRALALIGVHIGAEVFWRPVRDGCGAALSVETPGLPA
jgi:hypothetical protein